MGRADRGFTLIELIIVIVILCLLSLIAAPSITAALPARSLHRAALDIQAALRRARATAIKLHQAETVRFDAAGNAYTVNGTNALYGGASSLAAAYGYGVTFGFPGRSASSAIVFKSGTADTGDSITFDSVGLTGGVTGYVYVSNRTGDGYRIGIEGLAARIRLDKCGTAPDGVAITCLEN